VKLTVMLQLAPGVSVEGATGQSLAEAKSPLAAIDEIVNGPFPLLPSVIVRE
jgi:hypothetical protein